MLFLCGCFEAAADGEAGGAAAGAGADDASRARLSKSSQIFGIDRGPVQYHL
jgi:hypothetical protein